MEPLVSVCCISYNHEKFIRQCLDGFIMQKTNFKFEVIIHDDASTDRTAEIIKEYQEKHPDIIKPIFQVENQYSKNTPILKTIVYPQVKGKYVAICEGDDYWTDPDKLQKQVDFLEANPDYSICFHPVKIIYEDVNKKSTLYPSNKFLKQDLTLEKLLGVNFIQTNSVMYRWLLKKGEPDDKLPGGIMPGDWYLNLLHAKEGKIGFLEDVMSVYRRHSAGAWFDNEAGAGNLHRKHGLNELNFFNNVYKNLANNSEMYLNEVYLPIFKQILDNYYSFGDIDKLNHVKTLYPEIFEKSLFVKNPMGNKLKKYKKLYTNFLVIALISIVINIILIVCLMI